MNSFLQFIWWVIFLGPMFKVGYMMKHIYSINADSKIKLENNVKNKILGFITFIGLVIGVELAIHKLTLLAYILIIIAVFLILILVSDFFQNRLIYTILIIFPVFGFLGHWTGVLASETKSPFYLELLVITIPFVLPYVQYRLIFRKEKLASYINQYIDFVQKQKFQNKELDKFFNELVEFVDTYKIYLESKTELKNLENGLYLKVIREPRKTKIFKNKSYYEIKNRFKIGENLTSFVSETLSLLGGGNAIAGSDEESIVKSIGHFNDYLFNSNKKHLLRMSYLEFTKGKCNIIDKIWRNYYLMFYLTYVSNSKDYSKYFSNLKKYVAKSSKSWNERNNFSPLTDSQKTSIKEFEERIKKIEAEIIEEVKNEKGN